MSNYILCFDLHRKDFDYASLATCLKNFKATRLHNSVWLAELMGNASVIRDLLGNCVHENDAVTVIQLPDRNANWDWAGRYEARDGIRWLEDHYSPK